MERLHPAAGAAVTAGEPRDDLRWIGRLQPAAGPVENAGRPHDATLLLKIHAMRAAISSAPPSSMSAPSPFAGGASDTTREPGSIASTSRTSIGFALAWRMPRRVAYRGSLM